MECVAVCNEFCAYFYLLNCDEQKAEPQAKRCNRLIKVQQDFAAQNPIQL